MHERHEERSDYEEGEDDLTGDQHDPCRVAFMHMV